MDNKKNASVRQKAVSKIEAANFKLAKAARLIGQAMEKFQDACDDTGWDDMVVYDIERVLAKLGKVNGECMEYLYECRLDEMGKLDEIGCCSPHDSIDAL